MDQISKFANWLFDIHITFAYSKTVIVGPGLVLLKIKIIDLLQANLHP